MLNFCDSWSTITKMWMGEFVIIDTFGVLVGGIIRNATLPNSIFISLKKKLK